MSHMRRLAAITLSVAHWKSESEGVWCDSIHIIARYATTADFFCRPPRKENPTRLKRSMKLPVSWRWDMFSRVLITCNSDWGHTCTPELFSLSPLPQLTCARVLYCPLTSGLIIFQMPVLCSVLFCPVPVSSCLVLAWKECTTWRSSNTRRQRRVGTTCTTTVSCYAQGQSLTPL